MWTSIFSLSHKTFSVLSKNTDKAFIHLKSHVAEIWIGSFLFVKQLSWESCFLLWFLTSRKKLTRCASVGSGVCLNNGVSLSYMRSKFIKLFFFFCKETVYKLRRMNATFHSSAARMVAGLAAGNFTVLKNWPPRCSGYYFFLKYPSSDSDDIIILPFHAIKFKIQLRNSLCGRQSIS